MGGLKIPKRFSSVSIDNFNLISTKKIKKNNYILRIILLLIKNKILKYFYKNNKSILTI